jgi:pimeloyl-ACP methyl ester carboxylesterase
VTTETKTAILHGRAVTYAEAGHGPLLLLIHGMAGTYESWQEVIGPARARAHRRRTRSSRSRHVVGRGW